MDAERIEQELEKWHESRREQLRLLSKRCSVGPTLSALYSHLAEGTPLPADQIAHIDACSWCGRRRELIVAALGEAHDRADDQPGGSGEGRPREATAHVGRPLSRPLRRLLHLPSLRRKTWGALLLAASIIIAVGVFWHSTPQAMADIYADAANAGTAMFYFLRNSVAFFNDDPKAAEAYSRVLDDSRRKRDQARAAIDANPLDPNAPIVGLFHAWQGFFCGLREVGDIPGAIAENQAALAYARANPADARYQNWKWILLDGLGNTHAMYGDYAAARKAYTESLDLRRNSAGMEKDPHAGEPGYEGHLVNDLVIPYLRMVVLDIAEDNLGGAEVWLGRAEKTLRQQFTTICELNPTAKPNYTALPGGASAWEAWIAMPAEFRQPHDPYSPEEQQNWPPAWKIYGPNEGYAHRMGELLYHQAMLLRLKGDTAAAATALDRAATLEPYLTSKPQNDEYRLPFVFRLERARLAIVTGHYDQALQHLDEAEAYVAAVKKHFVAIESGEIQSDAIPDVNKLPISPACRAEMQFLRGVALLGLEDAADAGARIPSDAGARIPSRTPATLPESAAPAPSSPMTPRRAEALALIRKALTIPEKLAADLPAVQRSVFLKQFEAWRRLANQASPSTSQNVFNQETSP